VTANMLKQCKKGRRLYSTYFLCLMGGCCRIFKMGGRGPCPRPAALVHVGPMPSDTTGTVHRPGRDRYPSAGNRTGFLNISPAQRENAKMENKGEPPYQQRGRKRDMYPLRPIGTRLLRVGDPPRGELPGPFGSSQSPGKN